MLQEEEIKQFQKDGVIIIRNFFSSERVEALIAAWREARQNIRDESGKLQRVDRFIFGNLPTTIRELYQDQRLVQSSQQLLSDQDVALYMYRILVKDEHWNGAVDNHQDMPAFHGTMHKISAFVPLQPHNEATGGLKVVKGSHHYGNLGVMGTIHIEQFPAMEILSPSLEVGDVMFVDFLTWHYSEAAKIPSERPLLQIAYQSASDGSYYELEEPTLVSGNWRTNHFTRFGYGVTPNAIKPGESQLVETLNSQLAEMQAELSSITATCHSLDVQVNQLQQALTHTSNELQAIHSSKFWKLHQSWVQFKKAVGLAR